jgi:hypothetical protein
MADSKNQRITPSAKQLDALCAALREHMTVKANKAGDRDYVTLDTYELDVDGIGGRIQLVWSGLKPSAETAATRKARVTRDLAKLTAEERAELLAGL